VTVFVEVYVARKKPKAVVREADKCDEWRWVDLAVGAVMPEGPVFPPLDALLRSPEWRHHLQFLVPKPMPAPPTLQASPVDVGSEGAAVEEIGDDDEAATQDATTA